jgi:RNA polymerase sigma-70 factor (ECF subfamily)
MEALDVESAEGRYGREARTDDTPERAFDRRWALTLLDRALARCAAEYAAYGRRSLFDRLAPLLTAGDAGRSYAEIARDGGMTEGAVKVAAHRLRERYRRVLRDEVARTVSSPDEIDVELRHLVASLAPQRRMP